MGFIRGFAPYVTELTKKNLEEADAKGNHVENMRSWWHGLLV